MIPAKIQGQAGVPFLSPALGGFARSPQSKRDEDIAAIEFFLGGTPPPTCSRTELVKSKLLKPQDRAREICVSSLLTL